MEHLVLYFRHGMRDVIPYSDFIVGIQPILEERKLGEYLGDDMAIDGGDAEGIFSCPNAKELFEFLRGRLAQFGFMSGAKVTLVYGEVGSGAATEEFLI